MEFINRLVPTKDSEMAKEMNFQFGSYEDMGYRLFNHIEVSDTVNLSVQASYGHYCSPRKTLPLKEYEGMELAIFKDGEFVTAGQVLSNQELIDKLDVHYRDPVYGHVPLELIERLYQELTK